MKVIELKRRSPAEVGRILRERVERLEKELEVARVLLREHLLSHGDGEAGQ